MRFLGVVVVVGAALVVGVGVDMVVGEDDDPALDMATSVAAEDLGLGEQLTISRCVCVYGN